MAFDRFDLGRDTAYCDAHSEPPATLDQVCGHLVDASNALDDFLGEHEIRRGTSRAFDALDQAIDHALGLLQALQDRDERRTDE